MEALAFKQFDGANRNTSKKRKAENASRDTSIRNLLIELLNRDVAMMVYNSMRTEFPPIALSHIYNCWQQISDQLFLGKVPVVVNVQLQRAWVDGRVYHVKVGSQPTSNQMQIVRLIPKTGGFLAKRLTTNTLVHREWNFETGWKYHELSEDDAWPADTLFLFEPNGFVRASRFIGESERYKCFVPDTKFVERYYNASEWMTFFPENVEMPPLAFNV